MRNGSERVLEELTEPECLQLLGTAVVGRIAYCHEDRPQLVQVNFVLHEGEVVLRTSFGGKLAAAARRAMMTFGADEIDPVAETGWSVSVTGRARLVEDLDEIAAMHETGPRPWAPGRRENYVAIPLTEVSGRRIRYVPHGA